jgi:3-hydroxyisobutyrate dehydrogenase
MQSHGVRYLDCAVSGGPRGAQRGVLAALVGGDAATFARVHDVIGCFSDKITHLGPVGSGHMVKAINNALLAAHLLTASEAMATLARHGVDLPAALQVSSKRSSALHHPLPPLGLVHHPWALMTWQAINGSSGRSWCTMQRFPDNILTGDAYGFALGLHCKDMENAMRLIRAPHEDGTPVTAPMLELTRCLMNQVRLTLTQT